MSSLCFCDITIHVLQYLKRATSKRLAKVPKKEKLQIKQLFAVKCSVKFRASFQHKPTAS